MLRNRHDRACVFLCALHFISLCDGSLLSSMFDKQEKERKTYIDEVPNMQVAIFAAGEHQRIVVAEAGVDLVALVLVPFVPIMTYENISCLAFCQ